MTDLNIIADNDIVELEFDCLRTRQPIGDIFLASMPFQDITRIAYFDVRRVVQDRDIERYLGIQRPIEAARLSALQEYVNYYDASFPTAIIIAIDESYAEYDEERKKLIVSNVPRGETKPDIAIRNLARVIDGQHRIAGLLSYKGETFDVPVSIFIGADIADQAHIFSTVNLEQTKVNRSLVYDLYSLAKSRSPQKTCHNIAVALDQDEKSPLYQRVKRLGTTTIQGRFEPIAQAQFVEMLMRYITTDAKGDRDAILKNERLERASGNDVWKLPFRNAFIDDKDLRIADTMFGYFDAVRDVWPEAWNNKDRQGAVLNRTNGFRALMRAYGFLYKRQNIPNGQVSSDYCRKYFQDLNLKDDDFNITNFPPGSSGESRLLKVLTGEEQLESTVAENPMQGGA